MNLQPTTVTPQQHDYNKGTELFTRAVGHEKLSIISPAIRALFKRLSNVDNQIPSKNPRILDIGCGPFLLSIPFIRDGIHVDGVDTSDKMITVARKTLEDSKDKLPSTAPLDKVRLVSSMDDINEETYDVAMMNFVHQCAPSRIALNKLFQKAAEKVKPGGHLIITGAHPEYLHMSHACCEYDVKEGQSLQDGDMYTGRIFDETGKATYELAGDYFWSIDAITSSANSSGFRLSSVNPIDDIETPYREAQSPAYFIMHLRRP